MTKFCHPPQLSHTALPELPAVVFPDVPSHSPVPPVTMHGKAPALLAVIAPTLPMPVIQALARYTFMQLLFDIKEGHAHLVMVPSP